MLNRISKKLTFDTADMLYKNYILPLFDYFDTVWSKCGQRQKDALKDNRSVRRSINLSTENERSSAAW